MQTYSLILVLGPEAACQRREWLHACLDLAALCSGYGVILGSYAAINVLLFF